jgi:hypothetical protein
LNDDLLYTVSISGKLLSGKYYDWKKALPHLLKVILHPII